MRRDANVPVGAMAIAKSYMMLLMVINPDKLRVPGVKEDDGDAFFPDEKQRSAAEA
jgi:hypothetical protein